MFLTTTLCFSLNTFILTIFVYNHIGKALGKGTFGKVKLAVHTLTNEKVSSIQISVLPTFKLDVSYLIHIIV